MQRQHGGALLVVLVGLQAQGDALTFEGLWVGLDLHILIEQAVDRFLRFHELDIHAGLRMQLELLLYGLGQIPAEEQQRVLAMAFGVQEAPGVLLRLVLY